MSTPPSDGQGLSDFSGAIAAFKSGGWLSGLIGLGGMVARLLLRPEQGMTWLRAVSHSAAAILVAQLVWFILLETSVSGQVKAAALGVSGMAAPEILDFALRYVEKLAQNKLGQGTKPKRANGRKKAKR